MLPASIQQKRQTPALSHQKCNYRLSLRGGSACSSSFSSRNTTVAMLRRALQRGSTKRLIQDTVLYQTILNIAGTHIAYSVLSHLGFHKLLSFKKYITTKRHRFRQHMQTSQPNGLAPLNPFNYTIQNESSCPGGSKLSGNRKLLRHPQVHQLLLP